MTAQQLRNSILQQAIQGRLVPQDPNDEPASVLLERIRKEKEQLVKEGKLKKKDLVMESMKDEEEEFPIPSSWIWCHVGDLFLHASGKQQSSNNKAGTPHPFITTSNLYWNRFVLDNVKIMNFTDQEVVTCSATKGDLLVCEGGAGYGRSAIWNYDYDICLQNHVHRLRPLISGTCEYVYYFIYYLKETNQLSAVGTAMPGLSANRLKNLPIPLPPLAEQRRIVAKIEELMPLVEKYGKAQTELDTLNQDLPRRLRQSVLQQAIQGKLVEQDEKDEPIEVILRNFDKKIEYSIDEETPSGWCKISMGQITDFINGLAFKPEDWEEQGLPIVRIQNLSNPYAPCHKTTKVFDGKFKICKGDLLFSWSATLDSFIWEGGDAYLNQHIFKLIPKFFVDKYFLYYLLKAIVNEYKEVTHGSTMKHITKGVFENKIVLLPPLAEQRRIVAKIEELFAEIDKLK